MREVGWMVRGTLSRVLQLGLDNVGLKSKASPRGYSPTVQAVEPGLVGI